MELPPLTRDQVRQVDLRVIDEYGMSGLVLMENAGRGTVDVLEQIGIDGPVAILCGKGNNGGDGFVIARHLAIRGHDSRVLLLADANELSGDAATNLGILRNVDAMVTELWPLADSPDALLAALDAHGSGADWVVDALLGTGARGEPRPPADSAVRWFNAQSVRKLAVDVPSGLDCDTGEAASLCVRADHTCTFVAAKRGFDAPGASAYTGQVHVLDIGVPPVLVTHIIGDRGC